MLREERQIVPADIGTWLAVAIAEQGLTAREAAKKCEISEMSMNQYISGKREMKVSTLEQIAGKLGYLLILRKARVNELCCQGH